MKMRKYFAVMIMALLPALSFADGLNVLGCGTQTVEGGYRFQNAQDTGSIVFDDGKYLMQGVHSNGSKFKVAGFYTVGQGCSVKLSKQPWQKQGLEIWLTSIVRSKHTNFAYSGVMKQGMMQKFILR